MHTAAFKQPEKFKKAKICLKKLLIGKFTWFESTGGLEVSVDLLKLWTSVVYSVIQVLS